MPMFWRSRARPPPARSRKLNPPTSGPARPSLRQRRISDYFPLGPSRILPISTTTNTTRLPQSQESDLPLDQPLPVSGTARPTLSSPHQPQCTSSPPRTLVTAIHLHSRLDHNTTTRAPQAPPVPPLAHHPLEPGIASSPMSPDHPLCPSASSRTSIPVSPLHNHPDGLQVGHVSPSLPTAADARLPATVPLPFTTNIITNSMVPNNSTPTRTRRSPQPAISAQISRHFGDPWPRPKHHRHLRLSFANINGFDTAVFDNPTVLHLRQWLQETNTDIFLGCESKINWSKMPWDGQLSSWFRSCEALRTVSGYNTHEATLSERRQFGGTFGLTFGPIASRIASSGLDTSGLGRWSWFRFSSRDTTFTRVVVAYRPVKQSRSQLLSTYMQHSRFSHVIATSRVLVGPSTVT